MKKIFLFLFCLFSCSTFIPEQNPAPINSVEKENTQFNLIDYFNLELELKIKRDCQLWMNRNCQHAFTGRTTCVIQKLSSSRGQTTKRVCMEDFRAMCQNINAKPEYCEPESDGVDFSSKAYKLPMKIKDFQDSRL